jgi:hypothetical protein
MATVQYSTLQYLSLPPGLGGGILSLVVSWTKTFTGPIYSERGVNGMLRRIPKFRQSIQLECQVGSTGTGIGNQRVGSHSQELPTYPFGVEILYRYSYQQITTLAFFSERQQALSRRVAFVPKIVSYLIYYLYL